MYDIIKKDALVVEKAENAIKQVGLTPKLEAIRGGTDGARLTYEKILTPNLGTGGANFHSRYEFLSINQFNKGIEVLINLVKEYID